MKKSSTNKQPEKADDTEKAIEQPTGTKRNHQQTGTTEKTASNQTNKIEEDRVLLSWMRDEIPGFVPSREAMKILTQAYKKSRTEEDTPSLPRA